MGRGWQVWQSSCYIRVIVNATFQLTSVTVITSQSTVRFVATSLATSAPDVHLCLQHDATDTASGAPSGATADSYDVQAGLEVARYQTVRHTGTFLYG